jgi:hypothetical protein
MSSELRLLKTLMTLVMLYVLPAFVFESYSKYDVLPATALSTGYVCYWYMRCKLFTFLGCMYDPLMLSTYKL